MPKVSLELPEELNEAIENDLEYGDTKSGWIRHAIWMRRHVDPLLDDVYPREQEDERLQFVKEAVEEKIER